MPAEQYAERILRFVQARGYRPSQLRDLALAMGIAEDEMGDFHAACKALIRSGRVVLGGRHDVTLPPPSGRIVGTYRANPRGFGFVVPEAANAHGDLYIPAGKCGDAITGDTVAARLLKKGKRDGKMIFEGRIVEIIKRGRSRFVGVLHQQARRWFIIPDGHTLHVPIFVGDPGVKGGAVGDKVVVELTQYPDQRIDARGVIIKVLGPHGQVDVETQAIIEQYQLPVAFDDRTLDEARDMVDTFDPAVAAAGREDLRKLTTITIDPEDARDYDDAISLTRGEGTEIELGVHIADVAYFVREGGALDETAKLRGNSVYLPRVVIPMLPEVLSNGVCSLQEREIRLTKTALIAYDGRGRVKRARVANTVIRSAKRLTYRQAAEILDGKTGRTSTKVVALLKDMQTLAKRIRARRLREGMLELDLPDVELVHNDAGEVIDAVPADDSFPHKIIEMFMVEANEAVARLLLECDVPYLRRIHDAPTREPGEGLAKFLSLLGYDIPANFDRVDLQKVLEEARGKSEAFAVNFAVLRSMRQAEYSPLRVGHYALASDAYSHFTSPIRRYPDLTIHRLIDRYVAGELTVDGRASRRVRSANQDKGATPSAQRKQDCDDEGGMPSALRKHDDGDSDSGDGSTARKPGHALPDIPTHEELVTLGRHCSDTERSAEAAERELKLVLTLQLLEKHLGEAFDGVVTSVTNAGVFVQLERFLIDGLLRFDQLGNDWWDIDGASGTLLGELSGVRVVVGDRLKVIISSVHLSLRRLDLGLAEPLTKVTRGRKSTKSQGRNGKGRTGGASKSRGGKRSTSRAGGHNPKAKGGNKKGGKRR